MTKKLFNFDGENAYHNDRSYLAIDNILDKQLIEDILSEFPNNKNDFPHKGWKGNRVSLQFGTKEFDLFISKTRGFKKLVDYLSSEECYKFIFEHFFERAKELGLKDRYLNQNKVLFNGFTTEFVVTTNFFKKVYIKFFYNPIYRKYNIRSYFRRFLRMYIKPTVFPLISINCSEKGYLEPLHIDARHKMLVGLIYLDDIEEGGELVLYKLKKYASLSDHKMYPEYDDVNEIARIKSSSNKLVLFMNSNNFYHGTTPFNSKRRFIYFSYAFKDEESCFETNYPVYKGDATPSEI
jgi:hypothetical protein